MAEPAPIDLDWPKTALVIIDMQRDFMEPGGFGETLGNDVSQLARAVNPIASILGAARDAGLSVAEIAQVSHCSVPRIYQLLQKDETK